LFFKWVTLLFFKWVTLLFYGHGLGAVLAYEVKRSSKWVTPVEPVNEIQLGLFII
jgi:hypothetical protein